MRNFRTGACFFLALVLSACANLEFDAKSPKTGLTYFEPMPYLAVTKATDCKVTVAVLVLPGERKTLAFNSGYGSADLSATLSNGMLVSVGQKTDTKIPETITAAAGLAKLFVAAVPGQPTCKESVVLYPILEKGGKIAFGDALTVPAN